MSADFGIDALLADQGFTDAAARTLARAALEEAGLTRAGKQRISADKLPRVGEALAARFYLHCASPECVAAAAASGRTPVRTDRKASCERCGGSDNRRAAADFLSACAAARASKIVIVGGSPAVREELTHLLGHAVTLRLVDGTERRTQDKARMDVGWADLVLVWGASELHHKVSTLYTNAPPPGRAKIATCSKRGIAALLATGIEHLRPVP